MILKSIILGILIGIMPKKYIGITMIILGFLFGIVADVHPNMPDRESFIFNAFVSFLVGVFYLIQAKNESTRA